MDPPTEYNETLIAMLSEIAQRRGHFVLPIVRHSPSLRVIDGHHRLEVVRRLKPGFEVGHCFRDVEVDDPNALAVELNKARRPWDDAEERRTQAQILASIPVPGGRKGKSGKSKTGDTQSAPPSTRQIAEVLGVDQSTVVADLRATDGNPSVSRIPSGAGVLPDRRHLLPSQRAAKAAFNERRKGLRNLCVASGYEGRQTDMSAGDCLKWLTEHGIEIPKEFFASPRQPKQPKQADGNLETKIAAVQEAAADIFPNHITEIDLDATRQRINAEVQRSDRPADFKRAIELLTELDTICTAAWYRKHPEPWGHDDWAHVASEIALLHSIVGQRAEETANELIGKMSAIRVEATTLS